jgi:hypothetical protein
LGVARVVVAQEAAVKSLLAFVFVVGASAPALACSIAPCGETGVRLIPNGPVSVDELYFEVLVEQPRELVLRDVATGARIPTSIRTLGNARVFAPDATLTPGQEVELLATTDCETTMARRYTLTQAVARDGSAPLVTALAQGLRETDGEPRTTYSFVELSYLAKGSPESQTDVSVMVDGRAFWSLYGAPQAQSFAVRAYCNGAFDEVCGRQGSWEPGRHTVTIETKVVGQAPRVQSLEVDLDCDDGGRVESGELVPNPELRSEGVEEGGCQLGAPSGGGLLAALLALALRRRARSR